MLEQQIVYSSYNNSFISAPNNMKNFMLALLTMKRLLIVYGSLKHLAYKLQKEGIKGKFLKVNKSMYSSTRSCVKVNQNTMTESFLCNKGIMARDGLSPVLFFFMNDLPEYFRALNCLA